MFALGVLIFLGKIRLPIGVRLALIVPVFLGGALAQVYVRRAELRKRLEARQLTCRACGHTGEPAVPGL